jgi:hypothetical protein
MSPQNRILVHHTQFHPNRPGILWVLTTNKQTRPKKTSVCRQQDEQGFACCLIHAGVLLGLLFNPENAGDIFL